MRRNPGSACRRLALASLCMVVMAGAASLGWPGAAMAEPSGKAAGVPKPEGGYGDESLRSLCRPMFPEPIMMRVGCLKPGERKAAEGGGQAGFGKPGTAGKGP